MGLQPVGPCHTAGYERVFFRGLATETYLFHIKKLNAPVVFSIIESYGFIFPPIQPNGQGKERESFWEQDKPPSGRDRPVSGQQTAAGPLLPALSTWLDTHEGIVLLRRTSSYSGLDCV